MTLEGQKNHYNVKFLSGYGLSVSLKDNKIQVKNGTYPYSNEQDSEEWFVTNMPYEKIVISGKGYVSTEAISLLNENNRNVIITDTYGKPVSLMNGCKDSPKLQKSRTSYGLPIIRRIFGGIRLSKPNPAWLETRTS